MTVKYALKANAVVQYDGTNSQEILDTWDAVSVPAGADLQILGVDEQGGTLAIEAQVYGGNPNGWEGTVTVQTGEWVNFYSPTPNVITDAEFSVSWIVKP